MELISIIYRNSIYTLNKLKLEILYIYYKIIY